MAGLIVPDNAPGLGYFLVVLVGGTTIFLASKYRPDPFTITCSIMAALLATTLVLRDAPWVQAVCTLAAVAVGLAGLVRARTVAAFVLAGLAWPVAAVRGLPWLGRNVRGLSRNREMHAWGRTVLWSFGPCSA